MNRIEIHTFKTSFGELILGSYQEKLCLADWKYRKMRSLIDNRISTGLQAYFVEQESDVIKETKIQLDEYFKCERKEFSIPLLFVGTDFQKNVWNALLNVPYGETNTYLGLSKLLHNDKAIRAVASANGANAISIIVPCHRIIGSNGELVGYAGGLTVKQKLLNLEGYLKKGQQLLF
jgi:methylated-DNA-[protein]-cysteine S-methyltransferase